MNISCCKSYVGKEIIGLLPGGSSVPSECLWFFQPAGDVSFWTVSGESFSNDANINAILNPQGIYYSYYNTGEPGLTYYTMSFSYVGTEAPLYDLNILDSFSNPINPTWVEQCCTKTCYEIQIDGYWEDYQPQFFDFGFGNIFYNNTSYTIDNPIWEGIFKSMFGSQTVLTYVLGNPWSFKIDNAYACAVPKVYTGLTSSFVDMVPCAPPAATCLFSSSALSDSTGPYCFTDPSWDFNGQGVDFTAASAVYGGYAVNDGDPTILPYGGDTCSKVTFLYIGQNQPADVNVIDPVFGSYPLPMANQYCSFGCLTTNSIYCKDLIYYGIALNGFITVPFSSYGSSTIDLTDIVGSETIINAILSKYVPGSTVNITADGADYFTFTFNDIYFNPSNTNFDLVDSSGTSAVTQSMIDC